jgi:hypothetical protein
VGSCPLLVKRGSLQVFWRFWVCRGEGQPKPLLGKTSSALHVSVAIIMASPKLDKNPENLQSDRPFTFQIVVATDEIGATAANRRGASKQPPRSAQQPLSTRKRRHHSNPDPRLVAIRLEEMREVWPETCGLACRYHNSGNPSEQPQRRHPARPSARQDMMYSIRRREQSLHHRKGRPGLQSHTSQVTMAARVR